MSEKDVESNKPKESIDDEALERLAVEELLREAVQGAARAEIVGPSGWIKKPQAKTNKRFLTNTVRNVLASNKFNFGPRRANNKSVKRHKPDYKNDREKH